MPHRPEHGEDTWGRPYSRPKTLDGSERLEAMPRGGEDDGALWAVWADRCGMCGRERAGWATCAICSDEELADAA